MTKKMKLLVDKFATMNDFLRLCDSLITFDELSTANIYHVQLLHDVDGIQDAIKCMSRSLKSICEFSFICSCGDYATRYLIVSHVSPSDFEKLLSRRFFKFRTSNLYNLIF